MFVTQHRRTRIETVPNIVAVKQNGADFSFKEFAIDHVRDGALAAATQTGEPYDTATVARHLFSVGTADVVVMPGYMRVAAHINAPIDQQSF